MAESTLESSVEVRLADLAAASDATSVLRLLDHYSMHPFGSSGPLPADVRANVIDGLKSHPTTRIFLAVSNSQSESGRQVVGMAICFLGFSTFRAKTLINVHDLIVEQSHRGQGVGGALLDAVAAMARQNGWCAVTLEVRADNPARQLYARKGFQGLATSMDEHTTLFGKLPLIEYGQPQ